MRTVFIPLLFLFASVINVETAEDDGHCLWYGLSGGKYKYYNGPAKVLTNSTSIKLLSQRCPHMVPKHKGKPILTCCDAGQIDRFTTLLKKASGFTHRCPACEDNYQKLFCEMSCHPKHSKFLAIDEFNSTDNKIGKVTYALAEGILENMLESCKDVKSNIGTALTVLCGTSDCSPSQFMNFTGNHELSPIKINFKELKMNDSVAVTTIDVSSGKAVGSSSLLPLQYGTTPCKDVCSCVDCKSACRNSTCPVKKEEWTIKLNYPIDGVYFCAASTFGVFVLIFITITIVSKTCLKKKGPPTTNEHNDDNDEFDFKKASLDFPELSSEKSKEPSNMDKFQAKVENILEKGFSSWGKFCAKNRWFIVVMALLLCTILTLGNLYFNVVTDPVELWSAPDSRARLEKNYYESNFGPFYRTEMLIITSKDGKKIINQEIFKEVYSLQKDIMNLKGNLTSESENLEIPLSDICFKPLEPDNNNCVVYSALNYLQNNITLINSHAPFKKYGHLNICSKHPVTPNDEVYTDMSPSHTSCLGDFGGPIEPSIVYGGYEDEKYMESTALIVTFVNRNDKNEDFQNKALAWEKSFLNYMKSFEGKLINVDYTSERSIQDELDRESKSDISTVLISYLIMFAYVSVTLGSYSKCSTILVDMKISLGLAGVLIVLLSVSSSVGFFSYLNVPATLIIIEVIPFLVLAVGVDNIFILVQAYQRLEKTSDDKIEDRIANVVGKVGPSMLLTSLSESMAFFLGALTPMPAVKVFSLYAAMAVFIDFLLQISCFVSLMTFDAYRQNAKRVDVLCCASLKKKSEDDSDDSILIDDAPKTGVVYNFVKEKLSKVLLNSVVRPIVVIVFVGWFVLCVSILHKVEFGLDSKLSMPQDSYVLNYFKAMEKYLSTGAPVYFVVGDDYDYTTVENQNKIAGYSESNNDSLIAQVSLAVKCDSSITKSPSSWIDDYIDWTSESTECCRVFKENGTFCKSTVDGECSLCNITKSGKRPIGESFNKFIPWFLKDNPCMECSKGGHAAYGTAVKLIQEGNNTRIGATSFMTYHTVAKTSKGFIDAMIYARELGDNITKIVFPSEGEDKPLNLSRSVFPYSVFYVFYEQYLDIGRNALINLSTCASAIFVVTFILLGFDLWTSLIVMVTVIMTTISLFGLMFFWSIELNALSLVNIVMCMGISVEFCSHIARSFALSSLPTRLERSREALVHMGSSVLSGITLTKLGGIVVLAFSKSQLFQVYYFRMYFGIVLFGALHGLIFLPVFLSYLGPPVNLARKKNPELPKDDVEQVSGHNQPTESSDPIYDGR